MSDSTIAIRVDLAEGVRNKRTGVSNMEPNKLHIHPVRRPLLGEEYSHNGSRSGCWLILLDENKHMTGPHVQHIEQYG